MIATKLHRHWLKVIQEEGRNLTKWEEGFVESMADQLDQDPGYLSERQAEILERIYTERTA